MVEGEGQASLRSWSDASAFLLWRCQGLLLRSLQEFSGVVIEQHINVTPLAVKFAERNHNSGLKQLLDGAEDIKPEWVQGKSRIGVTAGASAPEILVQEVVDGLCALGADAPIEIAGRPENVTFSLPSELRIAAKNI